jgi:hypothetical protein
MKNYVYPAKISLKTLIGMISKDQETSEEKIEQLEKVFDFEVLKQVYHINIGKIKDDYFIMDGVIRIKTMEKLGFELETEIPCEILEFDSKKEVELFNYKLKI